MPFLVVQNVAFDPVYVGLFGANGVMFNLDGLTDTSTSSVQAWSSSFLGRWFIRYPSQLALYFSLMYTTDVGPLGSRPDCWLSDSYYIRLALFGKYTRWTEFPSNTARGRIVWKVVLLRCQIG